MAQSTPGSDPIDVAGRFVGLAELYLDLGQSEKAINLALQALEIFERVSGPEHPSVGTVLNNLALMYEAQRNYIKAVEMHRRSLRISEIRLGLNHPSTGVSLYNIGSLFIRARELEEAAPLLERALVIAEASQGAEHPSTGRRLSQLGDLHRARKRPAEAMTYYLKAYSIARRAGDVALAVQVQESLANHFRELDQIALAIYFGKEAVNSLQTLRANAQTLDRTLQRSLLATNKSTYQNLAQWLIEAGRLVEAQEVISMLKEEELQGFTQRRGTDDPRKTKIDFDLKERNWREKARGLEDRPGYSEALGALLAHLLDENNAAKVQPIADRTQLDNAEASKLSPVLRELREKGLAKTAALQILVSENKVQTIVTLADALYAKEVLINVDDLRAQVEQFRKVLQSPNQDPLPLAKGLYTVLLAPLMADLKTAGVEHLMLSLTDTLRYIPFGALHDGEKFLVQSYQLSMMTEAASGARLEQIATAWTVSGLGVSEKVSDEFQALPAVGRELNAIVRTAASPSGSLPGEIYINGAFTAERYRSVIEQAPTVIHLATHFKFSAGTESQSYLLLGDGQPLSLAEMMSDRYRFKGLDLLTLSACETGIGGPAGKDGREIEGLGAQAQRYGASAVLATLWQVADDSTFQLMKHFYALRGQAQSLKGTRMNKSEALREAQVSMIDGKFRPLDPQATQATLLRGASVANEIRAGTSQAQRYVFNPAKPFAHPFYWAPFVLMGNWL